MTDYADVGAVFLGLIAAIAVTQSLWGSQ